MRWKVHTPSQCGCRNQYIKVSVCKELLDEISICSRETGMMNTYAIRQELFEFLTIYGLSLHNSIYNLLALGVRPNNSA